MLRIFQNDITDPQRFVFTLELVPGRAPSGRSVDTVLGIARDAFSDGRVSAVSITDNPGGNPSLSPDAIGHQVFSFGMDVIVHVTCRDMNRLGLESRSLQLASMGMKNILVLTGDYVGKGFGGQGAPVYDLDSVTLHIMLAMIDQRINTSGDPDGFFTGCAVSPFKQTEGECVAQYAKLSRKVAAGAKFVITQLGFDARKFQELIGIQQYMGLCVPTLGTVYVLTPRAAAIMNQGQVPGAVVGDRLMERVHREWQDKKTGRDAAIERAARLGAILKGLGYRGIHISGIHRDFEIAGRILDRIADIGDEWQQFLACFEDPQLGGYYAFAESPPQPVTVPRFGQHLEVLPFFDRLLYPFMKWIHELFFNFDSPLAPLFRTAGKAMADNLVGRVFMYLAENPLKRILLNCLKCGDCAIQHVAFLCPESGCPKHIRNGACGGSHSGMCEVHADRPCIWFRAYNRLVTREDIGELCNGCVPPRMWELNLTSSWINLHTRKDHQSNGGEISGRCRGTTCYLLGPKKDATQ